MSTPHNTAPPGEVDVAVIGAGPAGSTLAALLAARGRRVLLVDGRPQGRCKCCGGCASAAALQGWRDAGLEAEVARVAAGATTHWSAVGPRGRMVVRLDDAAGAVLPRGALDAALVAAAAARGACVVRGSASLLPEGGIRLRTSSAGPRAAADDGARRIAAALVVGADGVGSRVARAAGLGDPRPGRRVGLSWRRRLDEAGDAAPDAGEIRMHLAPFGYLGAVRDGAGVHVGALFAGRGAGASPVEGALRAFARLHPGAAALLPQDLRAAGASAAGPMPWRPPVVADARVALVGDAAGYAEPFTGEGMAWAVETAHLLAAHALRGPWDANAAAAYGRALLARRERRHLRCSVLAAAASMPRLFLGAGALLGAVPGVRRRMVRVVVRGGAAAGAAVGPAGRGRASRSGSHANAGSGA